MFSKLLNFILVYILSILNFVIILFPLTFFILPLFWIDNGHIHQTITSILLISAFGISAIMITLLCLDFIFGFSVRPFLQNCKDYQKDQKYKMFFDMFEEMKYKFGKPSTHLLIKKSTKVNAFAVGGPGRNNVVLTEGLLLHYLTLTQNRQEFLDCIRGIIGHELSHLINKDYLPGLLLKINEQATFAISKIIFLIFNILIKIFTIIPVVGYIVGSLILTVYKIFDFFIKFFYKYVLLNVYKFLLLHISRSVEYRCDRQAAQACGGENMAFALSFLGENGYFTLFSTHPKTYKRIEKVRKVKTKRHIRATLSSYFTNTFSLIGICYITLLLGAKADVQILIDDYNDVVSFMRLQISFLKMRIQNFISSLTNR